MLVKLRYLLPSLHRIVETISAVEDQLNVVHADADLDLALAAVDELGPAGDFAGFIFVIKGFPGVLHPFAPTKPFQIGDWHGDGDATGFAPKKPRPDLGLIGGGKLIAGSLKDPGGQSNTADVDGSLHR